MRNLHQKIDRLCHKNSISKGGHSNIQHSDHTVASKETASVSNINSLTTNIKWVINISSKPVTKAQEKLLVHGPNYAVVPRSPPITEYVAAVEQASMKLKQGEADESRGEVKAVIKKIHPPLNITEEKRRAIKELGKDSTRMILTADKGVSLVVMDIEYYMKKAEDLLNQPIHRSIPTDPTTRYKIKLITLLETIKTEGWINEAIYRRLYSTEAGSSKFYGLPKIHKEGMP